MTAIFLRQKLKIRVSVFKQDYQTFDLAVHRFKPLIPPSLPHSKMNSHQNLENWKKSEQELISEIFFYR